MRRLLAHWMISRSIDDGRDVPAWVRRWSESDQETSRFEAHARRLAAALRADAPSWRALAPGGGAGSAAPAQRDQRTWIGSFGVAPRWIAAGVVALGLFAGGVAWRMKSPFSPDQQQVAAIQSANEAALVLGEGDWLLMAFAESQTSFNELVARLDPLRAPHSPGKSIETQVDAAVAFFAYRLPASTARVAGLERASSTLGSPDALSRFWLGKRGTL
jgi:hypothetical protein